MLGKTKKLFVVLFLFSLFVPCFADEAIVTYIKGKVEVQSGNNWVPVQVGQKLSEKAIVSTGFKSEAKIQYKGTVMALGPVTRISLDKLANSEKKEVVNVYLKTGSVRSKVTHPTDKRVSQSVRNPVSVCSVRGTDYIAFSNGSVSCFEGAVAVFPAFLLPFYDLIEYDMESEVDEDDNDSATATTEADDISDYAPKNAVVVAGGQAADVMSNGNIQKTINNSINSRKKVKKIVSTLSEEESVSISDINDISDSKDNDMVEETGSVIVDVVLPQE